MNVNEIEEKYRKKNKKENKKTKKKNHKLNIKGKIIKIKIMMLLL